MFTDNQKTREQMEEKMRNALQNMKNIAMRQPNQAMTQQQMVSNGVVMSSSSQG
jgi:hypothetical protein